MGNLMSLLPHSESESVSDRQVFSFRCILLHTRPANTLTQGYDGVNFFAAPALVLLGSKAKSICLQKQVHHENM